MATHEELVQFYSQFVGMGDLCFDIGAHWGSHTAAFRALYAEVVCVEPQPRIVQTLEHRFINDAFVHIVSKGVAARVGHLPMFISERDSTISTFEEKWKTGRFKGYTDWNITIGIPVITLDALIKQYGIPRFCKIDVEGFEYEVLRGLSVPIPSLSFEFTEEFFVDAKCCLDYLVALSGKYIFNFSLGASLEWGLSEWSGADEVISSLCELAGDLLGGDIYAKVTKEE